MATLLAAVTDVDDTIEILGQFDQQITADFNDLSLSNSFVIYSLPANDNDDSFHFRIIDGHGSVGQGTVMIQVVHSNFTTINIQPQSITNNAGLSASFTVDASGDTLTYQWQSNGIPIFNATNVSLTVSGLLRTNSGTLYNVVVTGAAGSVTSSNAVFERA